MLASSRGQLFDRWARSGPFVLMGALNAVVLVGCLAVRLRESTTLPSGAVRRG